MPQPKKQSRPRLDAVIRHIKAGSYDDDMGMLKGAIDDRNRVRQQAVLGMVKEVFGDEYVVQTPSAPLADTGFEPIGPLPRDPVTGEVVDSPHVLPVEDDDDLGTDYESRSPMIGSVDTSAQENSSADPSDAP
jgi:hypothetical protein